MKKAITLLLIFFLPSSFLSLVLRYLGHNIGKQVKIGFSLIRVEKLELGDYVKIGHFNVFNINKITLKNNTKINHFNIFKGPFSLVLEEKARIANQNYLNRGKSGITYGDAYFKLGLNSNITSKHFLDLTRSIFIGNNTVIGGRDSQLWTHGYYHAETGSKRIRIDGEIKIGNNVYIGSRCFFNPGVKVIDAIHIGGGSVVSKNLDCSGMYVGQGLRYIEQSFDKIQLKLKKVDKELVDDVYEKK